MNEKAKKVFDFFEAHIALALRINRLVLRAGAMERMHFESEVVDMRQSARGAIAMDFTYPAGNFFLDAEKADADTAEGVFNEALSRFREEYGSAWTIEFSRDPGRDTAGLRWEDPGQRVRKNANGMCIEVRMPYGRRYINCLRR